MSDTAEQPSTFETSLGPILDEMMKARDGQLYNVTLMVALTLPDICASLAAENGESNRSQYVAWLKAAKQESAEEGLPPGMDGPPEGEAELIYGLRCSFCIRGASNRTGRTSCPSSSSPTTQ